MGSPLMGARNAGGLGKNWQFTTNISAVSQKRHKTGTLLQWKANKNPYALYRIVLFPMTLSDPQPPTTTPFSTFVCHLSYLLNGWRQTSNLVSSLTITSPSLYMTNHPNRGLFVTHFKFWVPIIYGTAKVRLVKFCTQVGYKSWL